MNVKQAVSALLLTGLASAQALAAEPVHWEYTGKAGAANWSELDQTFATCKLGKEQSPVDIRGAKPAKLAPLAFSYTAGPAQVLNNGHTVQVNLADGGGLDLAEDKRYKLVQFHFHTPSEELIKGKRYPLVAHLVHKNDAGELAAVAVLFKEGKENQALQPIFADLPAAYGEKRALADGFNAETLLPARRGYYAFQGSLTTPPCSEGVRWRVLTTQVDISKQQLAAFRKLYPMNARPVQPLNGRVIQVSQSGR
jgi:carbonic anhydrase